MNRALDFGCGVGRMTLAMRKYAREVVGVDVAPGMLDVAREQAAARNVTNVEFRSTLPDQPVDWVNSIIVLQHIPPRRGHMILEQLVALLGPGGWFSVQLTFFRDERHAGEVTRDLADYRYDGETVEVLTSRDADVGSMSMYDYDLNRVFRTLFLAGIEEVLARHTDHAGCHGAWLFGLEASADLRRRSLELGGTAAFVLGDERRRDLLSTTSRSTTHLHDVGARRQVVHDLEQHLFEDRPQTAGTGAALQRLVGDRVERVVGEHQLDVVEVEELLVLLHQRVLRLARGCGSARPCRGCAPRR